MVSNLFREAGLPEAQPDIGGGHARYNAEIGVVRAVYPDIWCVDVEPQAGGLLRNVQLADHALPEVHIDGERPSYVEFWHRGGEMQDVWCRRVHWRRFQGPEAEGDAEKRYYHKHLKIERVGDLTIRITPDNRIYLYDAESGDYCLYEQQTRTFHVIGPHVFVGTDDADRAELHTGDKFRLVIPQYFLGKTGQPDADGITYLADSFLHLVSQAIKLTATESITLDPPRINFGHLNAAEQVILGNLFQTFLNTFLTLYNGHTHSNVQNGPSISGAPTATTPLMPNSTLSTIARVSQ